MGLPDAGKTYLATRLAKLLDATHFNADFVRKKYDDWDFSEEGRERQAQRMHDLAEEYKEKQHVVADFICPLKKYREIFDADLVIWMDTKSSSKYEDTDKIFEAPTNADIVISTFGQGDIQARLIAKKILGTEWDNQAPTVQLLGRWQPWHAGHRALFDRAFPKTGQVCIMLRDLKDEKNPFTFEERIKLIEKNLADLYQYKRDYQVLFVPNITNITYGRKVGYTIEQESFDESTENISATKIREDMKEK